MPSSQRTLLYCWEYKNISTKERVFILLYKEKEKYKTWKEKWDEQDAKKLWKEGRKEGKKERAEERLTNPSFCIQNPKQWL